MSKFSIDFVSPPEFGNLAVEISYCGQLICRIDKENIDGSLSMEVFRDFRVTKEKVEVRYPVSEFLEVLNMACRDLQPA